MIRLVVARRLVAAALGLLASSGAAAAGVCPGTVNFDNSAGTGLWQTAGNWDTNVLPGPADDVCIDGFNVSLTAAGTHTINSLLAQGRGV